MVKNGTHRSTCLIYLNILELKSNLIRGLWGPIEKYFPFEHIRSWRFNSNTSNKSSKNFRFLSKFYKILSFQTLPSRGAFFQSLSSFLILLVAMTSSLFLLYKNVILFPTITEFDNIEINCCPGNVCVNHRVIFPLHESFNDSWFWGNQTKTYILSIQLFF